MRDEKEERKYMYTDTCTAVQCIQVYMYMYINVNIGMVYMYVHVYAIPFYFYLFFSNILEECITMQLSTCKCWIGLYRVEIIHCLVEHFQYVHVHMSTTYSKTYSVIYMYN